MKIILGLILIGIGVLIIRYRYMIYSMTGDWEWATKLLGSNGTMVIIILIGAGCIFCGTAYPFGAFDTPGNRNIDTLPGSE